MKELYYCEYSTRDKNIRKKFTRALVGVLTAAFFLLGTIGVANTQTTVEIGNGTDEFYHPAPGWYGWQYEVYLYDEAAIGQNGTITSIAYNISSSHATTTADMQIWMKAVPTSTTLDAASTFNSFISGADMVYSDNDFDGSTTGWKTLTLSTPFDLPAGQSLLIAVKNVGCSTSGSCAKQCYYTAVTNSHWYKRSDGSDPGQDVGGNVDNQRSNIKLEITPTEPCAGTPDGGITNISPTQGNAGSVINANVSGSSFGLGLTYQWQSSDDNGATWTDIPGETNSILSTTAPAGVGETLELRRAITCDGVTSYSTPATFTVVLVYCTPVYSSGCSFGATVNGVSTTGAVNNMSNLGTECGSLNGTGYSDYSTNSAFNLMAVEGADFNIKVDVSNYGGGVKVWIDLNQNGTFETSELVTASASTVASNNSHNGVISIPTGTLAGETKMRVRVVESSTSFDPCASATYGEAEDYKITIIPASISPDITQSTSTPNCTDGTDLTTVGTPGTEEEWYWQESEEGTSMDNDATSPWTVFENGTYYVRVYNTEYSVWNTANSIEITNIPTAPTPPAPVAAVNPVCLPGTTISVPAATGDIEYYWQGTSNTSSSMADNAEDPYEVTETGTYYVKAYDTQTACWSLPESVEVTVNSVIPNDPIVEQSSYFFCENATSAIIEVNASTGEENSLEGQTTGGNGCDGGAMFDITNNMAWDALITGFDAARYSSATDNSIKVYYKQGSYIGSESNASAWTLLGEYPITVNAGQIQSFNIDELIIPSGETFGIYLNYFASYTTISASQTFTDGNITMTVGAGLCGEFSSVNANRGFNGSVKYIGSLPTDAIWYTAATGGSIISGDNPLETIGTSVIPTVAEGTYEFYAASYLDGCESANRTLVTVEISAVNVELEAVDASCNNGDNGSFLITSVECGDTPFTFSVDGGAFGPAPTDLIAGTHTVVVKDGNGNESGTYTITIGSAQGPSDLAIITSTNSTATIEWTANGDETSWNIEWGPVGFTPGTGTALGNATTSDNPFTIEDLIGNTQYQIYVSADCGGTTTPGDWTSVGLLTDCDPMPAIGFCEDFEDMATLDCWRVIDNNQDGETWAIFSGAGNSGDHAAGMQTDYLGGNNDDYIILPKFTLTGNEVLTFYAAVYSSYEPDELRVVLSTTGTAAADFTEVLYWDTIAHTDFEMKTVDLSDYSGDVYIAFHIPQSGYDGWYIFVDDVCIDICNPIPGIDGMVDVCRNDEELDLNTVIESEYTHGTWIFPSNQGAVNGSTLELATLASGTYELQYIVETVCSADTTMATVNVYPPSSAGIGGTITVCKKETINLFSAITGNVDMNGEWYDYQMNLIGNSQPTAPNLGASYNYYYVVSNGVCEADTAIVEVIVDGNCTSSIENEVLADISIYPNPTASVVNIVNPSNVSALKVELFDMNGRIVLVEEKALFNNNEATINIEKLETGVYTLKVYNKDDQKTFKVIKK